MKSFNSFKMSLLLGLFLMIAMADATLAQNIQFFGTAAPTAGNTKLGTGLASIVSWVYWIFYLLGAIFMGVGAFKLKQGDMGGFGKNMAGGATLFFVPAAIKAFRNIGQSAV
jgi:hypothetical protein